MAQPDYDSSWKDVLDLLFDSFMALFFPSAYAQVDWSRGFEFLFLEWPPSYNSSLFGRRLTFKQLLSSNHFHETINCLPAWHFRNSGNHTLLSARRRKVYACF